MAEPFLAEIRIMSCEFAPRGWALCNGQLMPINQNQALFSLLGTYYGGDGEVNFALPDLRGRVPIHMNGSYTLGQRGGEAAHTLSISELPQHAHTANATSAEATTDQPAGALLATASLNAYGAPSPSTALAAGAVASTGGSQAHLNMQPFLVLSFCIALQGIFPSRN